MGEQTWCTRGSVRAHFLLECSLVTWPSCCQVPTPDEATVNVAGQAQLATPLSGNRESAAPATQADLCSLVACPIANQRIPNGLHAVEFAGSFTSADFMVSGGTEVHC